MALATAREAIRAADIPRLLAELVSLVPPHLRERAHGLSDKIEVRSATEPTLIADDCYGFTPSEQKFYDLLMSRQGKFFGREAIMNALYFDRVEQPDMKILDVYACKVRRKLTHSPWQMELKRGVGFRIVPRTAQDRPSRMEWRGIWMGWEEAKVADALYAKLGKPLSYGELAGQTGAESYSIISARTHELRRNHLGNSPYDIETVKGYGFRMVLKPT